MRTRIIPLAALLVAACGGGGSDDTAVSANPPAPVAATPQPAPAPPPRVDSPTPIGAPAPKPEAPAPAPEPAPEPPAVPVPPPVSAPPAVPPAPAISATVLESAIRMMYEPTSHGSFAPFQGIEADSNVYISQATIRGQYQFATGLYFDPGDTDHPRYEVRNAAVQTASGSTLLDRVLSVRDDLNVVTWMSNAAGFSVTQPSYALDQTIAEWRAGIYYTQLQVQTDPASNTAFRLCWHLRTERIIRLACGRHDRLTGAYRGIVLVDDSLGLGPLTWQTQ